MLEQRALAAARAAEDEHLAVAHVEAHLVEQDEIAVAGGEVLHADDRFAGLGHQQVDAEGVRDAGG